MPNIILVEPDEALRDTIVRQLEAASPTATVFACGEATAALETVRNHRVGVLAIDVHLPEEPRALGVILATAARNPRASVLLLSGTLAPQPVTLGIGVVSHAKTDGIGDRIADALTARGEPDRTLASTPLARVLQLARYTRYSGTFSVRSARRQGKIIVEAGTVVSAHFEDKRGDDALRTLYGVASGTVVAIASSKKYPRNVREGVEITDQAVDQWTRGEGAAPIEITEDDLIDFLDDELAETQPSFRLFSDEELADLMLDDGMAIPVVPKRTPDKEDPS